MTSDSRFKLEPLIKFLFMTLADSGLLDMQGQEKEEGRKSGEAEFVRELIGELLKKAGKSKDEIVRIVAKEVGAAVATMMEKPLHQILKNHKIQVSIEFVPKSPAHENSKETEGSGAAQKPKAKSKGHSSTKTANRKTRRSSVADTRNHLTRQGQ